jgi:hypothetical protein
MNHDHQHDNTGRSSKMRIVFFVFLAIAAFFLLTEHRAHFFGILPYLLLAACPLMHVFGHHGHGGGRKDSERGSPPNEQHH